MSPNEVLRHKIDSRDSAHRLLARLTTGTVIGALAGVGVLGYVSAETIPGKLDSTSATGSSSSSSSTTTSGSTSTSTSSSSEDDSSAGSGLSSSSGSVSSSSGTSTPIAVTGGSR
ncbi:MAG TPA: hypothetical protein VFL29_00990 [Candidatus Dormibacteraeota bacterium]|nr:hypothetical protein [Candidatus Dormibacteraeota bacterium]